MLRINLFFIALFFAADPPAYANHIPGVIYGNCHLHKGSQQQNIYAEDVTWPFKTCPAAGTALPECEAGFQLVVRNTSEGNTDHANYNSGNKIYWITYGCAKK